MANAILMAGGGAGTGSDDCTATKAMVLQGYTAVTSESDDEAVAGTLPKSAVKRANGGTLDNYDGTVR